MAWHEAEGQKRPKYLFQTQADEQRAAAIARVPWPMWEGAPTAAASSSPRRRCGCKAGAGNGASLHAHAQTHQSQPAGFVLDTPEDEVAVYVTNLERCDATLEQVALLYAQRADTENVFDELKNQWGFRGYCSGKAVVTELAARLVLLTYNCGACSRVDGAQSGSSHRSHQSRRNFLFMAGASGRKRTAAHNQTGVKADWWEVLKGCYERLRTWLAQLRRSWNPKATFCACSPVRPPMIPSNGSLNLHQPDRLNLNCGF